MAKRTESDQLKQLDQLNRLLKKASDSYLAYVSVYPSPRLTHHFSGLNYALMAVGTERSRIEAVAARTIVDDQVRVRRNYSKFDQEIADKLIAGGEISSIDELEAWRERRRAMSTGKSISEQLAEVTQSDRIH